MPGLRAAHGTPVRVAVSDLDRGTHWSLTFQVPDGLPPAAQARFFSNNVRWAEERLWGESAADPATHRLLWT